ncbi:ABC transporter permease [Metabacillus sp. GX 13764]|uniref:ABC transporter permease n=1 Tax=Metabacillus kandeliae TaxID=2900151 RepID=UPI001E50307C|nr:ABC transporter permease [Metabacillus kandeliae]MCD7032627.1 ABC transporter permease [Metabacillus kandeliae]
MKSDHTPETLHKEYVKALKKEKRIIFLYQAIIFAGFFLLWETASRLNWIDPLIFSSPLKVLSLLAEKAADGSLFSNVGITVFETILGFLIGTLAGVLLAAVLWWSPRISSILDPYLVVLNAMPKVALGPILIVALGPGFTSIIAMGSIISIIITTIVIYTSFKEVDDNYLKVLKTFGASKKQLFKEAVLPASFPVIISALKVNVGLSWVGVMVGEFLVSAKGLGYLVIYGFQVFNFTLVFLSLFVIAIVATVMYKAVEYLEKKLVKYR